MPLISVKPPTIDWGAQSIRMTIFANAGGARIDDLFDTAFGKRPNAYQSQQAPAGISSASGTVQIGQATLSIMPGRIDLAFSPTPAPMLADAPGSSGQTPQHETVEAVSGLDLIIGATHNISNILSSASRYAAGVDLVKAASTHTEANALLNEILPYSILLTDEYDFLLQKNDVVDVGLDGLQLNAINRWAVVTVQQMQFTNVPNFSGPMSGSIVTSYFLAQKFVDVNTRTALKKAQLADTSKLLETIRSTILDSRSISGSAS